MKNLPVAALALALVGCAAAPFHWLQSSTASHQSKPSATAQSANGSSVPNIDLAYKKYVLPNGLTLIVHEDHTSPVVALDVWYHVGSKDETRGQHGMARLFERLMFTGSQHRDAAYAPALSAAGATDIGGSSDRDRSSFHETVPAAALDLGLWMESERMGYLLGGVTQAKLDRQRGVVESEKRQRISQPYGDVDSIIAKSTYPPGHPYAWTPSGSIRDLNAIGLGEVRDWFDKYYGAANATLVVSGDVKAAVVRAKVEQDFGDIPPGAPVSHVTAWSARMSGERSSTVREAVPQARLYMVWNLPPAFNADTSRLKLAAAVLADGKDSRLYKRLVQKDRLATDVSAQVEAREIGSQLVIRADAGAGVPLNKIEQVVDETLAKLLANGPQPAELDRVRTSLLVGFSRRLQSPAAKAELLARSEVYGGSPDAYKTELDELRNASTDDVRDSMRNWLADGLFVLDVKPAVRYAISGKDANQRQPPPVGALLPPILPTIQRTTLSNGMQLVLVQRGTAPTLDFDMLFGGGRASDADLPGGTAALTYDLLSGGTDRYSATEIDSKLQTLGAGVGSHLGPDDGDVRLSAVKTKLASTLDLYADMIRQSTFPDDQISRYKQQLLASIAQQQASSQAVVKRVLTPLLFGAQHPYAHGGLGSADSIQSIQRDDLVAYAKRWLRPDNATLLVTGDIDMATLKPLVEARFGDWTTSPVPLTQLDIGNAPTQAATRIFLINKPGASQSRIVAANLAPPPTDPQQPAFDIVAAALGGSFDSRLNQDLHATRHWGDDISGGVMPMRHQQIFYVGANVKSDRTAPAMLDIQHQLESVVDGTSPLTQQEIGAAEQAELRSLPGASQTLGNVAASYRHVLTLDLPDDYYRQLTDKLKALTPSQLQTAAQQLIHTGALTWIVVGDLSKIEQPIRNLNLGSVQVIDADGKPSSMPPVGG